MSEPIGSARPRVAVVTGGCGAIGSVIADRLESSGPVVEVLDRDGEPPCDLADASTVRAHARRLLDARGRVDVLVHAAAAFDRMPIDAVDLDVWRRVQAVNVESVLLLTEAFAPTMRAARFGRIVMIVSDTLWSPPAGDFMPYVASKAALVGLARTLATELSPSGVAVTCVAPGLTRTPAAEAGLPVRRSMRSSRSSG